MNTERVCPECGCREFDRDLPSGEEFCRECGYMPPETGGDICLGSPNALTSKGISTLLTLADPVIKSTFTVNSSETSYRMARELISQWAFGLGLNKEVVEEAVNLYSNIMKLGKTQGSKIEEIAAACLFIASKLHSPRLLVRFKKVTLIDSKKIVKQEKKICRLLEIKPIITDPKALVPYMCSCVGRGFETEQRALEVLNKCGSISPNPRTMASAAVFIGALLAGEMLTLDECARKTDTTQGTLANISEKMKNAI